MGRRAKHHTTTDRAAAAYQSSCKYAQSENGKAVRACSNRARKLAQGHRKVSLKPPRCIPHLPPLPSEVQRLHHIPLPTEETLYQQALSSSTALDEDSIHCWKNPPPFGDDGDDTDQYSREYIRFTFRIASVLHGIKMREQLERDSVRREEFKQLGRAAGMDALREEVVGLLAGWDLARMSCSYHPYHASRQYAMYQHYLQWQARTIYHLYYLRFLN